MNRKQILKQIDDLKDSLLSFTEMKEKEQPIALSQLGEYISTYRKRKRLSQEAFAGISGVSKNVIIAVENGKETVKLESLLKVINTLGLKVYFHA